MHRNHAPAGYRPVAQILTAVAAALVLAACGNGGRTVDSSGLPVVATLFPVYDIARTIGGEKAAVTLLIPPGTEPHSFEPRPADIARLRNAALFIYTNRYMEPWAENFARNVNDNSLAVIDAGKDIAFDQSGKESPDRHDHEGRHGGTDPHVWLDFDRLPVMVDTIAAAFIAADPAHTSFFRSNADAYKKKIAELDRRYAGTLADCRTRTIVSGGHATFGYLARRYGLSYRSIYGMSPNAEPSPADIARLASTIRKERIGYIFTEELLSSRMADTLVRETGVSLLTLHSGHAIGKDTLTSKTGLLALMEKNLENLKTGLQCGK